MNKEKIVDTITSFASSIQNPVLHMADLAIDNTIFYAALVAVLLFIGEGRNEKRAKVLSALVLAFLLVNGIKYSLAIERPCAGEAWCPQSYSFPSTHAAVAFALAVSFLDKKAFPWYLLFALFVAFSRMNLLVHVFADIAGALPVALVSYYIVDIISRAYVRTQTSELKGKKPEAGPGRDADG